MLVVDKNLIANPTRTSQCPILPTGKATLCKKKSLLARQKRILLDSYRKTSWQVVVCVQGGFTLRPLLLVYGRNKA